MPGHYNVVSFAGNKREIWHRVWVQNNAVSFISRSPNFVSSPDYADNLTGMLFRAEREADSTL